MKPLFIESTHNSPKVVLDKENNKFEISGKSLPENAFKFYQPIFDWLEAYQQCPNPETKFVLKFDYHNTATNKVILNIIKELSRIHNDDNKVIIQWHYYEDDEDAQDEGEDYARLVDIPFEFIADKEE